MSVVLMAYRLWVCQNSGESERERARAREREREKVRARDGLELERDQDSQREREREREKVERPVCVCIKDFETIQSLLFAAFPIRRYFELRRRRQRRQRQQRWRQRQQRWRQRQRHRPKILDLSQELNEPLFSSIISTWHLRSTHKWARPGRVWRGLNEIVRVRIQLAYFQELLGQ